MAPALRDAVAEATYPPVPTAPGRKRLQRRALIMKTSAGEDVYRLQFQALTAADLMSSNPISVRHDATVYDAVLFISERRINAAPVINDAGRAIGVVSMSDILIHDREFAQLCRTWDRGQGTSGNPSDATTVSDVMTPTVIMVDLDTPAPKVVERMLAMKIHQLFVCDAAGILAGVITPLDVLRKLHDA
jgi:CBS-domain-containing membrane protein